MPHNSSNHVPKATKAGWPSSPPRFHAHHTGSSSSMSGWYFPGLSASSDRIGT